VGMKTNTIMIMTAIFALAAQVQAYECKVCHSKNPKMVTMHKALQGKNCFECHKVGAKLMGKEQPKDLNSLLKRRTSDPVCLPCHGNQSSPLVQPPIPQTPAQP